MLQNEKRMLEILSCLKKDFKALALKAEFEAEGASFEEVQKLKELAKKIPLNLTLKIQGAEAIRDLKVAKTLDIDGIVAPMIESAYALEKFSRAKSLIFDEEKKEFFINIETKQGLKNLDEILESPYFKEISGIVFGRSDFKNSIFEEDINSENILNAANFLSKKMEKLGKKMTIGGKILPNSISFLKKIDYLTNFETRKIIFNADILKEKTTKELEYALQMALEFEYLWLLNFKNSLREKRIEFLKSIIA